MGICTQGLLNGSSHYTITGKPIFMRITITIAILTPFATYKTDDV